MNKIPDNATLSELYDPAMKIQSKEEALEYFELLVEHHMRLTNSPREHSEMLQKSNLGYYAGYHNNETRARVESLFNCEHPFFGSIAKNGPISLKEAFEMGLEAGKKLREKNNE